MIVFDDEYYMKMAIQEAKKSEEKQEVPVGVVIVSRDKVIAKAHNLTETLGDITAHAEIMAITAATRFLGGKFLEDCVLYSTLEPCMMCAGAIKWARPSKLVFGAYDRKEGFQSRYKLSLHPKTQITGGILEPACVSLLQNFFKEKR